MAVILLLCTWSAGLCQTDVMRTEGAVSYKNSQNVYVKFTSTKHIAIGDTLYATLENVLSPVLIVNHKSSISCVGTPLDGIQLNVDDVIVHVQKPEASNPAGSATMPTLIIPMTAPQMRPITVTGTTSP